MTRRRVGVTNVDNSQPKAGSRTVEVHFRDRNRAIEVRVWIGGGLRDVLTGDPGAH